MQWLDFNFLTAAQSWTELVKKAGKVDEKQVAWVAFWEKNDMVGKEKNGNNEEPEEPIPSNSKH